MKKDIESKRERVASREKDSKKERYKTVWVWQDKGKRIWDERRSVINDWHNDIKKKKRRESLA